MFSLPIARREMLVLAKSPALYRGRIILSLILLLAGIGFGAIYHYAGLRVAGQFMGLPGFFLLLYCLFAGGQATADSISREKREGTLGLLYLTHMRTGQILFGKLIAHTLLVFYALLTAFPLISLVLLLGGTEPLSMLKLFIAALNSLFWSASIGLFCSSIGSDRRRTMAAASWVIVLFWVVPSGAAVYLSLKGYAWIGGVLATVNPATAFALLGPLPATMPTANPFLLTLLVSHLVGWAFLLAAAWLLPRRWQDHGAPAGKRTFKERWQQFCYGSSARRRIRRRKFLDVNPFYWLSARHRFKPVTAWLIVLIMAGAFTWTWSRAGWIFPMLIGFTFGLTIFQKIAVGAASTTRLNDEHEQGTLELILSTPLRVPELIAGNFRAVLWQLRGPLLLIFAVHLFVYISVAAFDILEIGEDLGLVALLSGIFLVLHYFNLFVLTRLGLWSVVTVANPKKAGSNTIGIGVFLPVLASGLLFALTGVTVWYFDLNFGPQPWYFFATYFAFALLNDLFWLTLFQRAFARRLRDFASKRSMPQEKPGLIERLANLPWFKRRSAEPPLLRA